MGRGEHESDDDGLRGRGPRRELEDFVRREVIDVSNGRADD
jgi:hypothetical protein